MTHPACPYLTCEKMAFQGTLDLTRPTKLTVIVTWYCEHPFHGIRLELGDARGDMETLCAACSLPRPDGEES